MGEIRTIATLEKQDQILTVLGGLGGGIADWGNYQPFNRYFASVPALTDVVNITGEAYLACAIGKGVGKLAVEIDGVLVYLGYANSSHDMIGIVTPFAPLFYDYNPDNAYSLRIGTPSLETPLVTNDDEVTTIDYPQTGQTYGFMTLPQILYAKSSLRIYNNYDGVFSDMYVVGGIKI